MMYIPCQIFTLDEVAAWGNKDYQAIIKVARKIPDEALQEDEKLLLWYDQALTRTEADA